jgi:hypothetical protein
LGHPFGQERISALNLKIKLVRASIFITEIVTTFCVKYNKGKKIFLWLRPVKKKTLLMICVCHLLTLKTLKLLKYAISQPPKKVNFPPDSDDVTFFWQDL